MKGFFYSPGRLTAWKRSILSRTFFRRLFEALGLLWLVAEVMDRFTPDSVQSMLLFVGDNHVLPLFFVLSLAWALGNVRPVLSKRICVPNIDTFVSVHVADLARVAHSVVVSAGQFFDTSEAVISSRSLQGQITTSRFTSVADLDVKLDEALRHWASERDDDPARVGKRKRFPIGTTARVKMNNGENAYFVAMSFLHPGGGSSADMGMLQAALSGLWERLGTHGEFEKCLGVAIIGSGASRVPVSRFELFREILGSFLAASTQKRICEELRIYLSPSDVRERKIKPEDCFAYLEYKERFHHPTSPVVPAANAIAENPS